MGRLFGTDGVRGIANIELTAQLAYRLGQAGGYVLTSESRHKPKILVGMDTRISCDMLEAALIAGICSVGVEAVSLGVIPTPGVAYLTRYYQADAGVVISASHNPYEFNGIKFFDNYGYKLPDIIEEKIESIILDNIEEISLPIREKIGIKSIEKSARQDYINFLMKSIGVDLRGIKVAVDCANGAASHIAPEIFKDLGAETYVINSEPNGININKDCGSTHMGELQEYLKECNADIGIAFDGDADRVLAIDEQGNIIDGDKILAIIGMKLKNENRLPKNTIVATVMSNLGFDIMAKKEGLNLIKTKVGDRYVLEEMLTNGYELGGEQSGHIIFLKYNTTGDGILTALKLLSILKTSGQKFSKVASIIQVLPQVLKNAKVRNDNKHKYLEDEVIAKMCRNLENEFKGEGRVLIRPSGTEPLVRVMIEGKNYEYIEERAKELVKIIEERLG